MRRMQVAAVKRDFREVLDAAERGETTLVLRRGKPVAVITPLGQEQQHPPTLPAPREPGGLLSLVGSFEEWDTMEEDIAEIIADRQFVVDRPPPEFE